MDIRLFLAFELPEEIRDVVSQVSREARKLPLNVRWVKVKNIHLTVVFIGSVEENAISVVEKAMGPTCTKNYPFELSLNGLGFFGNMRNPRILWVGLNTDVKRMSRLRNDLRKLLAPLGVKRDSRPFKPHLTIGRFKKRAGSVAHLKRLLDQYRELTSPTGIVSKLVLFKSDLKKDGAVYSKINEWPLGG